MPIRLKFFTPLDVIHLLNVLLLVVVTITLVILSVVHKLHDCEGFYSRCHQVEPEKITLDSTVEGSLVKDVTALVHLLIRKLAQLENLNNFNFSDNFDIPIANNSDQNDRYNLSIEDHNSTHSIYDNDKLLPKLEALHNSLIRVWNYDWIGIDQYVILIGLSFIVILAFISALFRSRPALFAFIILYLSHIIQLALIEISDDRDFPASIFRGGKTVARYSLIYLDQTLFSLILKSSLLILFMVEFVLLIVSFVLIRYEKLIGTFPLST